MEPGSDGQPTGGSEPLKTCGGDKQPGLSSCGPHEPGSPVDIHVRVDHTELGHPISSPAHRERRAARSYDDNEPVKQDRNFGVFRRVFMAIVTKSGSKTSPREVLERAKATGVEVVDVRFVDLPGTWQHFSLP